MSSENKLHDPYTHMSINSISC